MMCSSQIRSIVPVSPFAVKLDFLPFFPVQSRCFLYVVPFDFEEIHLVKNFRLILMNVVYLSGVSSL